MIKTREDLHRYLESDRIALGIKRSKPSVLGDRIWKYERLMRYTEYWLNNSHKSLIHRIIYMFYLYRWKQDSFKLGNEIPLNAIDEGLALWHGRNIIINSKCKIGKNFGISAGCVVGQAHGLVPTIGDNVSMTIGSKVLGGITICNNVTIGASALVLKSVTEEYVTLGGIPAKILSHQDSKEQLIKG